MLRNFDTVDDFYKQHNSRSTLEHSLKKQDEFNSLLHASMTIKDALELLSQIQDDSDPDTSLPNIVHAYQTAEQLRKKFPNDDWLHLTGLIHDVGKILIHFGEPQWTVVGDTFPVGCPFSSSIVKYNHFINNPDSRNSIINFSKTGIYKPHCGFDNVHFSWGHDEYMYQVLKGNQVTLPEKALYMIRYHSFYAWHEKRAYDFLANDYDLEMLPWLKILNECDLYSKTNNVPNVESLKPYYQSLVEKYCPSVLKW